MKFEITPRGFVVIKRESEKGRSSVVVQESSAIGDYADSSIPGSSFLWIGDHHLSREEVRELVGYLQNWLDRKQLGPLPEPSEVEGVVEKGGAG